MNKDQYESFEKKVIDHDKEKGGYFKGMEKEIVCIPALREAVLEEKRLFELVSRLTADLIKQERLVKKLTLANVHLFERDEIQNISIYDDTTVRIILKFEPDIKTYER